MACSTIPLNQPFCILLFFFLNLSKYIRANTNTPLPSIIFLHKYPGHRVPPNIFKHRDDRLALGIHNHPIECLTYVVVNYLTLDIIWNKNSWHQPVMGRFSYNSSTAFSCRFNSFIWSNWVCISGWLVKLATFQNYIWSFLP